eukprot:GHVT01051056.1.p1 GENE.GHVT01051056.1~~GHVT01051056.1.p1  ORF type:complete len:647 (+),score=165.15 GHVT01051056.1:1147-3087(+)
MGSGPGAVSSRVFVWYLRGQLLNVAKAAVWWSMFGVLVTSLTGRGMAVGAARSSFNLALVLFSPVAGAVAEVARIRNLLILTTVGRLLLWGLAVPVLWMTLKVGSGQHDLFFWLFLLLMWLDGLHVAFANVVDIDCGGLDTASYQYQIPLSEGDRRKCNSIHQSVFDLSFVLFTPPVALLILLAAKWARNFAEKNQWWQQQEVPEVAAMVLGVAFVFALLSLLSLLCYVVGLPKKRHDNSVDPTGELYASSSTSSSSFPSASSFSSSSSWRGIWVDALHRVRDVREGCKIVLTDEKQLGYRLAFLALETALEDSMVSVVIPQVAVHAASSFFGARHSPASANVWAVALIAVGKLGGCAASFGMSRFWTEPAPETSRSSYVFLFWSFLASSLSVVLFPLSVFLSPSPSLSLSFSFSSYSSSAWLSLAALFGASFFFFIFTTLPKIGFATLLQGLVTSPVVASKVFGFVGTFVTITDAIVITLVNGIFVYFGSATREAFLHGLLAVSLLYVCHGLLEALLGPRLTLSAESEVDGGLAPIHLRGAQERHPCANPQEEYYAKQQQHSLHPQQTIRAEEEAANFNRNFNYEAQPSASAHAAFGKQQRMMGQELNAKSHLMQNYQTNLPHQQTPRRSSSPLPTTHYGYIDER